jgi:hypothetical protein
MDGLLHVLCILSVLILSVLILKLDGLGHGMSIAYDPMLCSF